MDLLKLNKENNYLDKRAEYDCRGIHISFRSIPNLAKLVQVEINKEAIVTKSIGYYMDSLKSDPKILRIPVIIRKGDTVRITFLNLSDEIEIEEFELLLMNFQS